MKPFRAKFTVMEMQKAVKIHKNILTQQVNFQFNYSLTQNIFNLSKAFIMSFSLMIIDLTGHSNTHYKTLYWIYAREIL